MVSSKQAVTRIPGPMSRSWPLILCLCPSVRLSVSLLLLVTGQWKAVRGGGLRLRHRPPWYLSFLVPVRSLCSAQVSALERAWLCSAHTLCLCPCVLVWLSFAPSYPPLTPSLCAVTTPCGCQGTGWGASVSRGGLGLKKSYSPKNSVFWGREPQTLHQMLPEAVSLSAVIPCGLAVERGQPIRPRAHALRGIG